MKKLFLASFAHITLDSIVELLPGKPSTLKVAFVTTAADPYDDKDFVNMDRNKLLSLGFHVTDLDIKNKSEKELELILEGVDVIAVAGGNTYYLLHHARKSGFLKIAKKLIDKGVIYAGSSAGSILACPTIDSARFFDPPEIVPELNDYSGMNLVDFLIIPHFEKPRYLERMRRTIEQWSSKGFHLYPLTDQQAILVDGDKVSFIEKPL